MHVFVERGEKKHQMVSEERRHPKTRNGSAVVALDSLSHDSVCGQQGPQGVTFIFPLATIEVPRGSIYLHGCHTQILVSHHWINGTTGTVIVVTYPSSERHCRDSKHCTRKCLSDFGETATLTMCATPNSYHTDNVIDAFEKIRCTWKSRRTNRNESADACELSNPESHKT